LASAFRAELKAGNGSNLLARVALRTGDGLYLRQALEMEGLLPVKFSLEPAWDRKLKVVRRSRARRKKKL
jgi:hypothetical protein